jgi:hypothetical protein
MAAKTFFEAYGESRGPGSLEKEKTMDRLLKGFLFGSVLLVANLSSAGQAPDGTVTITSRSVSPGIGLSWGDGVLTYKGQNYPFVFQAKGLFRDVDARIAAMELSGQVFNLQRVALFNGTYHRIEGETSSPGGGSHAMMKNTHGVVVDLVSTVQGRKFILGRDGMSIELKQQKP